MAVGSRPDFSTRRQLTLRAGNHLPLAVQFGLVSSAEIQTQVSDDNTVQQIFPLLSTAPHRASSVSFPISSVTAATRPQCSVESAVALQSLTPDDAERLKRALLRKIDRRPHERIRRSDLLRLPIVAKPAPSCVVRHGDIQRRHFPLAARTGRHIAETHAGWTRDALP